MNYTFYDFLGEELLFSQTGFDDKYPWEELQLISFIGETIQFNFLLTPDDLPILFFGMAESFLGFIRDKQVKELRFEIKTFKSKEKLNTRTFLLGSIEGEKLEIKFRWGEGDQDLRAVWIKSSGRRIVLTGNSTVPGWRRHYYGDFHSLNKVKPEIIWSGDKNEKVSKYLENRESEISAQKNLPGCQIIIVIILVIMLYWIFG